MEPSAIQTPHRLKLQENGFVHLNHAIENKLIRRWQILSDRTYQRFDDIAEEHGPHAIQQHLTAGQKHVPTASSFTLGAVFGEEEFRQILQAIATGPAGELIHDSFEGPAACDLDQAWLRRQFAPGQYPPQHAPHSWHQDGALGSRFSVSEPVVADATTLLRMITCWIPLVACGLGAPGLEIIAQRVEKLLVPSSLLASSIRSDYSAASFFKPAMEPGDLLLFHGDVLHRTQVDRAMQSDRTSIELRFFPAKQIPARLAGDRFVPLMSRADAGRL